MGRPKKTDQCEDMYKMYQSGLSLSEVGMVYGISRQSVYEMFKNHGKIIRAKKKLVHQEFNGNKYTMRNIGYLGKTYGNRSLMHRDVWEYHNGEIPDGFDIHHKNGDRTDNRIENLEMIEKSEHGKIHSHEWHYGDKNE